MALKGVKPKTVTPGKPKIMIFGVGGIGKTWWSLDFPAVYYIDTEAGADRVHYQDKLEKSGGSYFGVEQGSRHFPSVIDELKALATEKHPYKTVVIDSLSKIYNIERTNATEKGGDEFGRDKKEANKPIRRLMNIVDKIDMNVIFVCHELDKWEDVGGTRKATGKTFDAYDKLEYEMHLILRVVRRGTLRKSIVMKTHMEQFPHLSEFDWTFDKFAEIYGRETIFGEVKPLVLATPEQVATLTELIDTIKVDQAVLDKWKVAAGAETWSDMTSDVIQKCIENLKGKLPK